MGVQSRNWDELLQALLDMFESDTVNVEEVEEVLASYKSDKQDWKKFAKHDKYKYTRNLVHEGNGKFNLMLLCWAEGNQSAIHDHANAHCFVKIMDGTLRETRYHWPKEGHSDDGKMVEKSHADAKLNAVSYMSDELGLHRMENPSHSSQTVSLHLYSPPFKSCQVFDERTGQKTQCKMTFWSKYGEKVNNRRAKTCTDC
eukprot:maker-scaffold528_size145933-snap-gene-0.31 protein:Tk12225 transcript:maker-scaffold528_size145933-snap-gene-0.31-mRNA-1 annotation:"cysteine dioxygenase type 1"